MANTFNALGRWIFASILQIHSAIREYIAVNNIIIILLIIEFWNMADIREIEAPSIFSLMFVFVN